MNRKPSIALSSLGAVFVSLMLATTAWADVFHMPSGLTSLEMVTVGNPGTAPDTRYETAGYGTVNYTYQIGKYEVTNSQYCEFLNAKLPNIDDPDSGAQYLPSDTYGLYYRSMETYLLGGINYDPAGPIGGKFSIKEGFGNRPVNHVSWYDSVRFVNWLTNGQGSGDTEIGSYLITDGGRTPVTSPSRTPRLAPFGVKDRKRTGCYPVKMSGIRLPITKTTAWRTTIGIIQQAQIPFLATIC